MDIKNLTTFICVAELNSFTRAARELGFSQSIVSFQIKQLLYHRKKRVSPQMEAVFGMLWEV